jgi:hypothetical protein
MQHEILMDAGSDATVYPKKFANELGTKPADTKLKLMAVDGTSIEHHGVRSVPFELQTTEGVQKASMTFQVAGVVRPVASVGELCENGFDVHFVGGEGWMSKDGKTVEFKRRGNKFILPIFKVSIKEKEDLQNHLELCPFEGQDGDEQVDMEPLAWAVKLLRCRKHGPRKRRHRRARRR